MQKYSKTLKTSLGTHQIDHPARSCRLHPRDEGMAQHGKICQYNPHINNSKEEKT